MIVFFVGVVVGFLCGRWWCQRQCAWEEPRIEALRRLLKKIA